MKHHLEHLLFAIGITAYLTMVVGGIKDSFARTKICEERGHDWYPTRKRCLRCTKRKPTLEETT